jgi:hypothetical protein
VKVNVDVKPADLWRDRFIAATWAALCVALLAAASCGTTEHLLGSQSSPDGGLSAPGSISLGDAGLALGSDGSGGGVGEACVPGCGGGQICVNGSCQCPPYQSLCAGSCIPTSVDPNNCGKCGNTCAGATACSAGECAASCLPGLTLCSNDHTCTDTSNDSDHCGSCTNQCPAGQGCAKGECVDGIPLGPAPAACAGGGPPIVNPPSLGGCLGALAATTFRWTLCSCEDVQLSDLILVDAFDSTRGPYMPGGVGGGVGADDKYHSSGSSVPATGGGIWGDLWASSPTGIDDSAGESIKHDVRSGGALQSSAAMTIGADAYANGDVNRGITIDGKLYVPAGATVNATSSGGIVRGPVSFAPPCDCAPNQLVPISAIVQAHASPHNDNAAIGLPDDLPVASNAPARLDLPCGSYYLSSIHHSVPLTIWAHGQTALYIGGDVQSSDDIAFGVDPTGSFDIFILGTLSTSAKLTVGSPNYPALTRTYVASAQGVDFSAAASLGGNVYAAYGLVTWSAAADAYGSVFAGNFNASAATRIHYDTAVLEQGVACPPGGTGGAVDGGPACTSCRDCLNQACIRGQCGACQTDTDCCAPLVCSSGTCVSTGTTPR